ncbi:hypothetical protein Plec18170_001036 [Paecilomyces lecythidis]
MASKHVNAIQIEARGKATIKTVPLPKLRDNYLLIRTTAVAINPTDWKHIEFGTGPPGSKVGCDYAGVIEEVGPNVVKPFKKGDRVAGFAHGANQSQLEDGAFGEYNVVKEGLAIVIPKNLSDVEAATIGLGLATVGQGLYQSLQLPFPTEPIKETQYILIYGGATATGMLGVQFAKLSGYTVVTTCSPDNFAYIKSLGADAVFDYHDTENCVTGIRAFTQNRLRLAWDCVSSIETARICAQVLSSNEDSHYSSLLNVGSEKLTSINPRIHARATVAYTALGERFEKFGRVFEAKPEDYEFAQTFFEQARDLLEKGKVRPVRQTVNWYGQGLEGVLVGLQKHKEGLVRGAKLVYTLPQLPSS